MSSAKQESFRNNFKLLTLHSGILQGSFNSTVNMLRSRTGGRAAQEVFEKISVGKADEKKQSLQRLARHSADVTFAGEFISRKGVELLVQRVENGQESGENLAYTLTAFLELMDHGIVSWDILSPSFVKRVAGYVNNKSTHTDATVLQKSLAILESITLNSNELYQNVSQETTFNNLIPHLKMSNAEVQQNCIALMNALCLRAPEERRKKLNEQLSSKEVRSVLLEKVVRSSNIGQEMAHQLYVFQQLTFNLLEARMMTTLDETTRGQVITGISDLRKLAFDTDHEQQPARGRPAERLQEDNKKLGFTDTINPTNDFKDVPPGMLVLDNMIYFAKNHTENYTKTVLENSCRADEHACPFINTCIHLMKMLCEILKVGEQPAETGQEFYPMFFTCDNAFEEFFCICVQLLNKTWKEMRARISKEDYGLVMATVKEQITRTLNDRPLSMDNFKTKIFGLSYNKIVQLREQERLEKAEWDIQAKPVLELREHLKPSIIELIKQQRLSSLVDGQQFNRFTPRGRIKDKYWYCRLSPNNKVLHFGDIDGNQQPPIEALPNKLQVSEIRGLVTGKDCPHMKEARKGQGQIALAFSIMHDPTLDEEARNFVAPNTHVFNIWTDGINALLGNDMTSEEAKNDMETLLGMEIRLRLLDTENVPIPQKPPPIPNPPNNYDFYYDFH
ncbi:engulfment and cell motility protein 1-like isoform X2 [Ptychodera flava]|uniref:engulfment and cell motility protein 1-like isoform X2 n=1 Tax=Ptychodera flava TaxID=63121 RepID=UPI00396A8D24